MKKMSICESFPITNEEYNQLDQKFANLCRFAAWQLLKKNARNNHTDDFEDIHQELLMAILRAGSYYKRQIYIEQCLVVAAKFAKDRFVTFLLHELENLWHNRTRHGAGRQKYGWHQEKLLEKIVVSCVPWGQRPDRSQPLKIDGKFTTYCKSIAWNSQKSMGRKITREKAIRAGCVSLSEYDHMGINA